MKSLTDPRDPTSRLSRIAAAGTLALGVLSFVPSAPEACAQNCPSDINGNGKIDGADLAQLLTDWGNCHGVVNAVTPQHGSSAGGTLITITGFNLETTTVVRIGGTSCTNLQVLSPVLVRAVTPAGDLGDAAITVVSAEGTAFAPTPFSYVLQAITAVTPSQGTYSGGTAITITGSYLSGATSVKVGGVPATNVVAVDATTVTAVTPAGSVGAATVEVTTPKGTATATGAFGYIVNPSVPAWATLIEAMPDPAVVTNETLRNGIIATGLAWRVRDTGTQIEMLLVPPGTFMMGASPGDTAAEASEFPVHQVSLTSAFYIGRYELTQAQWVATMGSNPSIFQGDSDSPSRPLENASWTATQNFLALAALRLPTEAEWEYSYRGGTTTAYHSSPSFPSGTNNGTTVGDIGWYSANSGNQSHAVGGKAANALGLHDMAGNMNERVSDWWGSYGAGGQSNPTGPTTGSLRTLRIGAYNSCCASHLRCSKRFAIQLEETSSAVGFRVARDP